MIKTIIVDDEFNAREFLEKLLIRYFPEKFVVLAKCESVEEAKIVIEKFNPEKIVTAVYLDKEKLQFNIKRFLIETTTLKTPFSFIKEGAGNYVVAVSTFAEPILAVHTGRGTQVRKAKFKVSKMVDVMGWKAIGTKLVDFSKTVEMAWENKVVIKDPNDTQPELF